MSTGQSLAESMANVDCSFCQRPPVCVNNNANKLIFGHGTSLVVQTNVPSDPVYYKLEAEDKSVKACLAADFSNYSAANEGTFKNITATRIQGESLFSKVVAWTTDDDKCSEFGKEGGDTGRCDSDAYFETDEKSLDELESVDG
ncbi:hypothetical protein AGOR_G00240120 [Albula goreensis]|uniref:Uncharacterized protein n=1 Tax=Albula goreensis TaxID=1534307 RepID=A0A8T3CDX3_9TELE|nr:hypothetical protein AGOR_G00240120 [Albula goreensis]